MKALISPNENFNVLWVSSWEKNLETQKWEAKYSEILNCFRVAQVELDNNIFSVAEPLFWIDCPDDCKADQWYYKDGQVQIKLKNVAKPEGE